MSKAKKTRILAAAKELNVGRETALEFLKKKGFEIDDSKPDPKISAEMYNALLEEYADDKAVKKKSDSIELPKGGGASKPSEKEEKAKAAKEKEEREKAEAKKKAEEEAKRIAEEEEKKKLEEKAKKEEEERRLAEEKKAQEKAKKEEEERKLKELAAQKEAEEKEQERKAKEEQEKEHISAEAPTLHGPKVVATIDLTQFDKPVKKSIKKKDSKEKADSKAKVSKKEETKKVEAKKLEKNIEKQQKTKQEEQRKKEAQKDETKKEENVEKPQEEKVEHISMNAPKLEGPTVVGKIELPVESKKPSRKERRKRKRIPVDKKGTPTAGQKRKQRSAEEEKTNRQRPAKKQEKRRGPKRAKVANQPQEIDAKEIQERIRETQAKLAGGLGGRGGRMKSRSTRRTKREEADKRAIAAENQEQQKVIQVTEFISVSELASLLDVNFAEVISTCMSLGIMVSINQRLDAEVIELVASEYDTEVEFLSLEDTDQEEEIIDKEEDLVPRAPIVTIMGHVDHGKTSLLDYIRNATVVAGEAGGITQHIGAYKVTTKDGKHLSFLDTPGHEAFTAMRARGAKVADVAIIVVAADDAIMPQTKEAISHAQAAGLPMVFAINKIDKETANPEKIKEQLSAMNILVEDWGGKYQSQEISAKKGINIDELLEKVLLESELLELKANPDREGIGTIIEAELDKGRGYVSTAIVETGTLKEGDMIVAGQYFGKVRAMMNERGQRTKAAGPSTPVQILGLNGAPQAGERFRVYEDESEAKNIANNRAQILREQGLRTRKHITLDEIGRRLALGNFKELNIIIKADYDGSAEALSDSLQKLSTEEIHVNVVLKGVGQITESDVNLASASDAIIIGFQVRPSVQAARLAEEENIEIRNYSIIYDAIEELKSAMEGMLEPKFEKKVVGNIEVRETYKISAIGTIAGCYVMDGKFTRKTQINVIRDGIVIHTGELASLKRFKDDVKEVVAGYECGLSLKGFNDIRVGDVLEGFEEVEIKRKL